MQTHLDDQHGDPRDFMQKLQERADKAKEAAASTITAGSAGEQPLAAWKASNGIHCRHMPDDEQGILRISVGGGEKIPVTMNYITVRGKVGDCITLLQKAIDALRECPE